MRVRGFTQDDAHIFCLPEQVEEEIVSVLDLTEAILSRFGFDRYCTVAMDHHNQGSLPFFVLNVYLQSSFLVRYIRYQKPEKNKRILDILSQEYLEKLFIKITRVPFSKRFAS